MNDVIKCLTERRSVRKFKPEQIKCSELEEIIRAGLYAPTGMNRQSPIMLIVQDKEVIAELSRLNAEAMGREGDPFYGAPTVVCVLADKNVFTYLEDGSLVMGNMLNAAHSLGVDSCWIHRAREVFDTEYGRQLLRSKGISDDYVGIGNCILGYRDCPFPEAPAIKAGRVFNI